MNKPALVLVAIATVTLSAFAALKEPASIALRYVPAEEAYAALKKELGVDATQAVGKVDIRNNALTLDPSHPQAAKIREFLATFDVRMPQVQVDAVITRQVAATATKEAYEEVLSRPTAVVQEGKSVVFQVAGEDGTTKIELRIKSIPAEKK